MITMNAILKSWLCGHLGEREFSGLLEDVLRGNGEGLWFRFANVKAEEDVVGLSPKLKAVCSSIKLLVHPHGDN